MSYVPFSVSIDVAAISRAILTFPVYLHVSEPRPYSLTCRYKQKGSHIRRKFQLTNAHRNTTVVYTSVASLATQIPPYLRLFMSNIRKVADPLRLSTLIGTSGRVPKGTVC
eukprot:1193342-Prorocentrum_minimum.AAC.2